MRRPLVAANWKMHLLRAEVSAYARAFPRQLGNPGPEVVLFPSFPLLDGARQAFAGRPVALGAQDVHPEANGAFTGDVAAAQLRDAGCAWVLCGHSERRRDHAEGDELVGRKAAAAQREGLRPLVCVGERKKERRGGETLAVLDRQLAGLFASPLDAARLDLAYEPVWAIGTGKVATTAQAQEVHAFLRSLLAKIFGDAIAQKVRILYGGSMKPSNAPELLSQKDIDGGLIGGAALETRSFVDLVNAAIAAK